MKRDYRLLKDQALTDIYLESALAMRTDFVLLRALSILLSVAAIAVTIWMIVRIEDIGEFGWGYFLLSVSVAPLAAATATIFASWAYQRSEYELRGY